MNYQPKILAFAGALRKDSTNKKTVKVAAEGARKAGAEVTYVDLNDFPMPIYNGDIEAESGLPENTKKLQKLMVEHQGFLISSPEYNSSITAVLKNTLDWASRSYEGFDANDCFRGKIALIMSASPGGLGGLRGLFDVKKILSTMNVIVLPEQFAVSNSYRAFDENGNFADGKIQTQVEDLGKTLAEFLTRLNS